VDLGAVARDDAFERILVANANCGRARVYP